jgi:hypothetical protein
MGEWYLHRFIRLNAFQQTGMGKTYLSQLANLSVTQTTSILCVDK